MRKLTTKHYELARDQLAPPLREPVDASGLREEVLILEQQAGRVDHVRGEPAWMRGGAVEATAVLRTKSDRTRPIRFRLVHRGSAWRISDLDELLAVGVSIPTARNRSDATQMHAER